MDGALRHPERVRERTLARTDWVYGAPVTQETWPGMRVRAGPGQAFTPELAIETRWNRLLVYQANLIHAATGYFGTTAEDKRMFAVLFWLAR